MVGNYSENNPSVEGLSRAELEKLLTETTRNMDYYEARDLIASDDTGPKATKLREIRDAAAKKIAAWKYVMHLPA